MPTDVTLEFRGEVRLSHLSSKTTRNLSYGELLRF